MSAEASERRRTESPGRRVPSFGWQASTGCFIPISSKASPIRPGDTSATLASVRELVSNPGLAQSITHLERTLSRLDRIFGAGESDLGTTFQNLRQITDNLRDLTEDAKRYPSNLLFGAPPRPLEPAK